MERVLSYQVLAEDDGLSMGDLLRKRLFLSSTLIKKIKYREDGILLNGARVYLNARVQTGDAVCAKIEDACDRSDTILPCPGPLSIVYEDADLLIVDKPADLAVIPSPGHYDRSLANFVLDHYLQAGQAFTFRAVNRLDRPTSGLMVIAKHAHAHELCRRQLLCGQLRRTYLALAVGCVSPEQGTLDAPIARKAGSVLLREVRSDGAPAVTHYETLLVKNGLSLLRLQPETGRTHQLRVHMAHLGFPLLGDFLYGAECPAVIPRTALHSAVLSLPQPITGEPLRFELPLPEDMARLLK